jgi:hypothetical protein
MADTGFPLPGSSYGELVKIIQGYGRVGSEATLADVAHLTAIGETIISANNKFLVAVGIVQGGKKKSITPLGSELANALQHELLDEIAVKWRAVVEANDFLQKVVASVRIRKGMDESSLESHVAYSAGQPKTPAVTTGAGAVVEILKNAALLREEGGNLVAAAPEPPSIPETVQKSLSISEPMPMAENVQVSVQGLGLRATAGLGGVQLTIDVTVQCTPGDLDDLGHKLRKVIQDFNEPREPQKQPDSTGRTAPAANEGAKG